MKIKELVNELQKLIPEYGGMDVEIATDNFENFYIYDATGKLILTNRNFDSK